MKYALLIYGDESEAPGPDSAEAAEVMKSYFEFTNSINEQGINRGGEALQSVQTATCVKVRDGQTLTTDGPYAETKEQLGGFYLIEVDDLDAALEVAARLPGSHHGTVEVRPVWEVPSMPEDA